MEVNNFQKLMEEDEIRYNRLHHRKVESGVQGTLGFFRLVGDLFDMFVPCMRDVFIMSTGGRCDEPGRPRSGSPPTDPTEPFEPGRIGPGMPPEDKNR